MANALARVALLLFVASWFPGGTKAQEHHPHHVTYKDWHNRNDRNCCNNQDCRDYAPSEVRTDGVGRELKVEGKWCPIQSRMLLKKGRSPDYNVPQACLLINYGDDMGVRTVDDP